MPSSRMARLATGGMNHTNRPMCPMRESTSAASSGPPARPSFSGTLESVPKDRSIEPMAMPIAMPMNIGIGSNSFSFRSELPTKAAKRSMSSGRPMTLRMSPKANSSVGGATSSMPARSTRLTRTSKRPSRLSPAIEWPSTAFEVTTTCFQVRSVPLVVRGSSWMAPISLAIAISRSCGPTRCSTSPTSTQVVSCGTRNCPARIRREATTSPVPMPGSEPSARPAKSSRVIMTSRVWISAISRLRLASNSAAAVFGSMRKSARMVSIVTRMPTMPKG